MVKFSIICIVSVLVLQVHFGEGGTIYEGNVKQQTLKLDDIPSYKATIREQDLKHDLKACNLEPGLVAEIAGYQRNADLIIEKIMNGDFKGRTLENLARFVDKFGPRVSGTAVLENSIDYMIDLMNNTYGFDNVYGEEVVVPHYFRGKETAEMLTPRKKNIALLGLVPSVGTGPEGLTADVLVVQSFEELEAKAELAKGKIVVYNQPWVTYGTSVKFRSEGAVRAGRVGAVAALVRSITPFSMNSPHTGGFDYETGTPEIPVACITVEDAELLYRLQEYNETISIHLSMLNYNLPPTTSRNVFGGLTGREKPEEIVAVSGHIDSWDMGQGAMDDGGGVFISVEALAVLKELDLIPKRTLNAILWTSEEVGLVGVQSYVNNHEDEMANYTAVFESDSGTFRPKGLEFAGSEQAACIVREVLKLLHSINATDFAQYDSVGSDISMMVAKGVPGMSLDTVNDRYFWFHHSAADTISVQNSEEMDLCLAVWTVTSYVIADLSVSLPRE